MTADEKIAFIRLKIERAKEHIHDLEIQIQSFFATKPYVIMYKRDPEAQRVVYYVASARETPAVLAILVGEVLHNLRSALDHLAYALFLVGTGGIPPCSHIYFPIAEDAAKYETEKARKVKGMRDEAIAAIDAIKPYRGGNDILWLLHKLNNIDKHRNLNTIGSAYIAVNPMSSILDRLRQLSGDPEIPDMDIFIKPSDSLFPLKAGDELYIDASGAEPNGKIQFRFNIAFGEPPVTKGEPLIETLKQMADLVDSIVSNFKPLLS